MWMSSDTNAALLARRARKEIGDLDGAVKVTASEEYGISMCVPNFRQVVMTRDRGSAMGRREW